MEYNLQISKFRREHMRETCIRSVSEVIDMLCYRMIDMIDMIDIDMIDMVL